MTRPVALSCVAVLTGVLTVVLASVALVLAVNNPEIGRATGETYTCLAPWDTAMNDADNYPGGEPPPDADQIAAQCQQAGKDRFITAIGVGIAAGMAVAASIAATLLATRQTRRAQGRRTH